MKISWGTGIAIFYGLFMASMIYMVVKSTKYDRNLVVENYYEKDLQYQSHLDKLNNAKELKTDVKIEHLIKENYVRFTFPKEFSKVEGEVLFYRPSDRRQDFKTLIRLDENNEFIYPTNEMKQGEWQVKIDWKGDETPFFKKKNIYI